MSSDVVNFAAFMRLSAPATPAPLSFSAQAGQSVFGSVGCAMCHTPSLQTGPSPYTGMSNVNYNPYSDFALHHMGSNWLTASYREEPGRTCSAQLRCGA